MSKNSKMELVYHVPKYVKVMVTATNLVGFLLVVKLYNAPEMAERPIVFMAVSLKQGT